MRTTRRFCMLGQWGMTQVLAMASMAGGVCTEPPVGPILDPAERATMQHLVGELRDDDHSWNCIEAYGELWSLRHRAAPWLRMALLSSDRQQRQYAAALLRLPDRRMIEEGKRSFVSELMLRACVESLEDDSHWLLRENECPDQAAALCDRVRRGRDGTAEIDEVDSFAQFEHFSEVPEVDGVDASNESNESNDAEMKDDALAVSDLQWSQWRRRDRGIALSNATDSVQWFLADIDRIRQAAPILAGQLDSADPQASFLSAYLLARIGGGVWRDRIVPIMVASLADNEIQGDAVLATQAIAWLGKEGLPELRQWLLRFDVQADLLLRHAIAHIAGEDDFDGVTLCGEVLQDLGFTFDPLRRDEETWRPAPLPNFPSAWSVVPLRTTLQALPTSVD